MLMLQLSTINFLVPALILSQDFLVKEFLL